MPKYDVAVVGAGVGGLLTAAFLAKRNKKVILLETAGTLGDALGFVETQGFRFSPMPSLTFGFEQGGAAAAACAELGIHESASLRSPSYQVALPDRRVSIFAEPGETLEELRREFPREIDGLVRFTRDMEKAALRIRTGKIAAYRARYLGAARALGRYRFSRELVLFFDLQSRAFFRRPLSAISLRALVTLVTASPLFPEGGMRRFADQLVAALLRNGGEVRYGVPWPEISFVRNKVEGLVTAAGLVEAEGIVVSSREPGRGTALFLGLREDVIPVGMERAVICLPDYSRPEAFFTLSLSSAEETGIAPKGMRAVSAVFSPGFSPRDGRGALMKQVAAMIPFLEQYLVVTQELKPAAAKYPFPPGMRFKPVKTEGNHSLVERSSPKIYVIHDGKGWLGQEVSAARKVVEKLAS